MAKQVFPNFSNRSRPPFVRHSRVFLHFSQKLVPLVESTSQDFLPVFILRNWMLIRW